MAVKFEKVVLKNDSKPISFTIEEGSIFGVYGNSGSNKTEILETIACIEKPKSGIVKILKNDIVCKSSEKDLYECRKKVGYIYEDPNDQFFHDNVYDELVFSLKNFGFKEETYDEKVKKVLAIVGLNESYLKRNPFSLSSGEAKKIALASVLIYNPKIIMIDDLTIGLDYLAKKEFVKIIRTLKKRFNKTIILSSKDVDFLHSVVDKVIVVSNKAVLLEGTKYNVLGQEKFLNEVGLEVPKLLNFANLVKNKKGINLGYRDDINDLMKDVYRNVK